MHSVIRQYPRTSVVLLLTAMWVPLVVKAIRNALEPGGNDFTILYRAGERLLQGESLYDGTFVYPPPFAFLMAAVALVPYGAAAVCWSLSKVALAIWSVVQLARLIGASGARLWAIVILGPLFLYRSFESDLVTGNSNVLLLAGVVFVARTVDQGQGFRGGVVLGLVSSVKLSPAYLVAVLGACRRWRSTVVAIAVLVGATLMASLAVEDGVRGSDEGFFGTSSTVFRADEVNLEEGRTGYVPGQSVRALLHRLTRPIDATAHDRGRFVTINWITVENSRSIDLLYLLTAGLFGLLGLIAIVRSRATSTWALSLGCVLLLWIAPYARKAHFVLLLPAIVLLFRVLLADGWRTRRILLGLVSAAVLLGPLTSKGLWGREISSWLVAHCPFGLCAVVLGVGLWLVRDDYRDDGRIESSAETGLRAAEADQ